MKGYYQHYKGGYYQLISEATHSETGEELVVYKSLTDDKVWVRPLAMFLEAVKVDGGMVPRFRKVHPNNRR